MILAYLHKYRQKI